MAPLEQIKQGILSKDLKLVAAGYAALTGEDLDGEEIVDPNTLFPKKKRGRPRKAQAAPVPAEVEPEEEEVEVVVNNDDIVLERVREIRKSRGLDVNQFMVNKKDEPSPRLDEDGEEEKPQKRKTRGDEDDEDENKRYTKAVPFVAPKGNKFKDTGKIAKADIELDKKLQKNIVAPTERREEAKEEKKVKVECGQCSRKYTVPVSEAKRSNGEEDMDFVCTNCIRKKVKRDD
jgi:hypothetical protein